MNKNSCQEFCESENSISNIFKTLKIVNKPYKDTYVPGINIQGKYLEAYGFLLGDEVAVEVSTNRILIERIIKQ